MKIIITNHFEKREYKFISRYFTLDIFCNKLKKINLIKLKDPYFKLKFYLGGVSFRGVILVTKSGNFIPLMISLKKDKDGENIIWDIYKKEILEKQEKVLEDIKNGNFSEF